MKRELKALRHDPWQLALLSYIPLIGVFCFWWFFSAAIPRHLPVAVIDHDHSSLSRSLIRRIEATPAANVISYNGLPDAELAMKQADVYAIVVLPNHLRRDILTGHQPTIDIRYNTQLLLVGKRLSSQLQQSLADGLRQVARSKLLGTGIPKVQADILLQPLTTQITPFYNLNRNYLVFLLPPILIALGQILAMLIFANSLSWELRMATMQQWLSYGALRAIAVKALIYIPLVAAQGCLLLAFLYLYLGLPFAGEFSQLLIAQWVMLVAIWLMVTTLFFLLQDSARLVSFCAALFAPALPFMGITFPTSDMPLLAQWWRQLMPSSHYIDTHISIVSYAQSWQQLFAQFLNYWGYCLLVPLLIMLAVKKRERIFLEQHTLAGES